MKKTPAKFKKNYGKKKRGKPRDINQERKSHHTQG